MDEHAAIDAKTALQSHDARRAWRTAHGQRASERRPMRWLTLGLVSSLLYGCGATLPVMGGKDFDPVPGRTLTLINVTFKNEKCVLDLNVPLIATTFGEVHYWSLTQAGPPRPLPVAFDKNGIDISQGFFPFLYDFVHPMYSGHSYQWTANPNFTSGIPRSYDVHATWTKPDGTTQPCVATDPYIVNRGTSAEQ